jgi:hypothetical protein
MGTLEYLIKLVVSAAPQHPGSQARPLYILLNLAIPIILGILLSWITQYIEKGLNRLLGEKR